MVRCGFAAVSGHWVAILLREHEIKDERLIGPLFVMDLLYSPRIVELRKTAIRNGLTYVTDGFLLVIALDVDDYDIGQ